MQSTWLERESSGTSGWRAGSPYGGSGAARKGNVWSDDAELLTRLRQYDEEAMGTLYDRYHMPIYQFVLQMSGDAAVAGDVTQDLFLLVLEGAGQRLFSRFDSEKGNLEGYLLGVARKLARKQLGRQRRWSPIEMDFDSRQRVGEEVETKLQLARLRSTIYGLPWKYREVIVLCCLQERSYEQAAGIVGCSVGTVASRLSRARQLLWQRFTSKERP